MDEPHWDYVYRARVVGVVDGDTIDITARLGFYLEAAMRVRLSDLNAPEMHGPSREAGLAAKAYTAGHLLGREVLVRTRKSDSFGRWLARVWVGGADFNEQMIAAGHAVAYRVGES